MKNYLKMIAIDFFNVASPELDFLRWLISNKYEKNIPYPRPQNKNAQKKLCPNPDADISSISDKEYEQCIYRYALEEIPQSMDMQHSEYVFLLYAYCRLSYFLYKGFQRNNILNDIISSVRHTLKPEPKPGETIISLEDLERIITENQIGQFTKTADFPAMLSLTDCIIFALYLWVTDLCFFNKYQ